MAIIDVKDIYSGGNPFSEIEKALNTLIEAEKQLLEQNKLLIDSYKSISKTNDGNEAKQRIDNTTRLKSNTEQLTVIQKERQKVEKQLEAANAKNAISEEEQTKALIRQKKELQENNRIIKLSTIANDKNAGAIERLQAQTSLLIIKRKKLTDIEGKSKKEYQKLTKKIKANTDKLKSLDDEVGNNQRSVGKYSDALKGLGGKLVGAFAAIKGLQFAFDGLKSIINATAGGQIFLAKVTGAYNAVLATLRDKLIDNYNNFKLFNGEAEKSGTIMSRLGNAAIKSMKTTSVGYVKLLKSVGNFFTLDFKNALDNAVDGLGAVTLGMEDATKKSKQLLYELKVAAAFGAAIAESEKRLQLDKSKFSIIEAKNIREIADLRAKAADKENYSAKERQVFLEKALILTKQNSDANVEFAKRDLELQQAVFNANKSNIDEEIKLNEVKRNADEIEAQSLKKQKLLISELQTVKKEADREYISLEQNKNEEIEFLSTKSADVQIDNLNEVKLSEEKMQKEITDAHEFYAKQRIEIAKTEQELTLESLRITSQMMQGVFSENTVAYKAFATIQIAIDTYMAAMKAYRALADFPPAAILAASATYAYGAAQIAKVNNLTLGGLIKFEDGGEIGGKSHKQGGTVIEAEKGEFIIRKSMYASAKNLTNDINNGIINDVTYRQMLNVNNTLSSNTLSEIARNTAQNGYAYEKGDFIYIVLANGTTKKILK